MALAMKALTIQTQHASEYCKDTCVIPFVQPPPQVVNVRVFGAPFGHQFLHSMEILWHGSLIVGHRIAGSSELECGTLSLHRAAKQTS